ncbi:hypothetical protein FA13DRAFT_1108887 [Coprinellus micaceus]|uniref:Uncharacterized protein n=1 Tax=Coprinellus micaceus TaxID=71717 RepID=A0A4Y7RKH4_COPMI|nr:hypothetical protein FA13DRAFT_1108887 [Coprinellus micaceus]
MKLLLFFGTLRTCKPPARLVDLCQVESLQSYVHNLSLPLFLFFAGTPRRHVMTATGNHNRSGTSPHPCDHNPPKLFFSILRTHRPLRRSVGQCQLRG